MGGYSANWSGFLHRLREAGLSAPRLCGRCGGLGERWRWWRGAWRECRACHGAGGVVHEARAWREGVGR